MTLNLHNPRPPPRPLIPAPPLGLWFVVLYALLADLPDDEDVTMTLEQDILKYLENNGLFASEAKESLAILKAKPTAQAIRWTEDASQYPKPTVVAIMMNARQAAVEWIDKNAPQHWARGIFDDKRA